MVDIGTLTYENAWKYLHLFTFGEIFNMRGEEAVDGRAPGALNAKLIEIGVLRGDRPGRRVELSKCEHMSSGGEVLVW